MKKNQKDKQKLQKIQKIKKIEKIRKKKFYRREINYFQYDIHKTKLIQETNYINKKQII